MSATRLESGQIESRSRDRREPLDDLSRLEGRPGRALPRLPAHAAHEAQTGAMHHGALADGADDNASRRAYCHGLASPVHGSASALRCIIAPAGCRPVKGSLASCAVDAPAPACNLGARRRPPLSRGSVVNLRRSGTPRKISVIVGITENTLGRGTDLREPGPHPTSWYLIEISISWDCANRGPASKQNHNHPLLSVPGRDAQAQRAGARHPWRHAEDIDPAAS